VIFGVLNKSVDFILPSRCLGCGQVITCHGTLCPACWSEVQFIADPSCECCGWPFEFKTEGQMLCAPCLRESPVFNRARAAIRYETKGRDLVLRFKHADATHAVPMFAEWMCRTGGFLLENTDLILPVPLHWTRLFLRQYNQAALLAQCIGFMTGIPFHNTLFKRQLATPSQGHLKRAERKKNVRDAFIVPKRLQHLILNQRITLVDDVLTTGATVNECARVLKNYGTLTVDVLCLARVV